MAGDFVAWECGRVLYWRNLRYWKNKATESGEVHKLDFRLTDRLLVLDINCDGYLLVRTDHLFHLESGRQLWKRSITIGGDAMPDDRPLILGREAVYYLGSSGLPGDNIEEYIMALDIYTGSQLYQVPLEGNGLGYHYLPLVEGFQRSLTSSTCSLMSINGSEALVALVAKVHFGSYGSIERRWPKSVLVINGADGTVMQQIETIIQASQIGSWSWSFTSQAQWLTTEAFALNRTDGRFHNSQPSHTYIFRGKRNEIDRAKLAVRPFGHILAAERPTRSLEIWSGEDMEGVGVSNPALPKTVMLPPKKLDPSRGGP
ncbi:hypothetical protein BJX64DRAFT_291168 [Aspergillus heterothallicus]